MAIKLINTTWCDCREDYVAEYLCDTDADLATLPTACTGSTAVSIESGKVKIVNTSGQWVSFAE